MDLNKVQNLIIFKIPMICNVIFIYFKIVFLNLYCHLWIQFGTILNLVILILKLLLNRDAWLVQSIE